MVQRSPFAFYAVLKESCRLSRRVHVPEVLPHLTAQRVMAMEFVDGLRLGEPDSLRAAGLDPAQVSRLIAQTFNEMIFTHGDVHCDPHPANLLVRKDARGRPQLVLLDHGACGGVQVCSLQLVCSDTAIADSAHAL